MLMLKLFLISCASLWQLIYGNALPEMAIDSMICAPNNTNPKIVIIGAGPSGIAAATKLLEHGFRDVQILEAEPRIGGRVHTIEFSDYVIDLGAQWCHGEKDNVVYELASKYDLLEAYGSDDFQCIRSNRETLPPEVERRLKDIVVEPDVDELRQYNGSFGAYLTDIFNKTIQTPENADISREIAKEFIETFKKMQCAEEACDNLEEVSARGVAEYQDCEGHPALNWKHKGFKEFLKLLIKSNELGTELGLLENHVTLSKTVSKINWNTNEANVEIICSDGETIRADHVIVTASLGVLKAKHADLFEPQLPKEKVRAIDGISFGTVNKIFLEFSEPFWPANWTGFSLLWRDEDLNEIRGTSLAWLEDIFGFYPVRYRPKLLEGWAIGSNGRYMETLPTNEVLNGSMFLLKKFLSWEIPDPVNIKTTAWFTNENFRGSYSFRSVHTLEVGASAVDLARPLVAKEDSCNKPLVQFAGEATNKDRFATVHGAAETGWREARVLAKFYGKL